MGSPDLFIIGAPKSGTTSLYDYLAGHPQVYMSPLKEPLYFCPDVISGTNARRLAYPRDSEKYLDLFADARDELRRGEATTRYLVSRDAPRLIHDAQPNAYAVAILRNPVEMLHALHGERVAQGHEPISDFADALVADADRARGERLPAGSNALGAVYRETARYAQGLERWFSFIGRDRVLVLVFDDFVRDPGTQFRHVLEFLEVHPAYVPPSFEARNSSYRQRARVRAVLDSRMGDFVTHDVLSRAIGTNRQRRLALRFRQSRLNRRAARRDPIPAGVRAALEEELKPEVERLSEMLGRDLVDLWFGVGSSEAARS